MADEQYLNPETPVEPTGSIPPYLTPPITLDQALVPDVNNPPDMQGVKFIGDGSINWPANSGVALYREGVKEAEARNAGLLPPSEPQNSAPPTLEQLKAGSPSTVATPSTAMGPATPTFEQTLQSLQQDTLNQFDAQKAAINKAGNAAAAIEANKAAFYKDQAKASEDAALAVQNAYDISSARVEEKFKERETALQSYREMLTPAKINEAFRPNGIFEGKGVGQTILGALAIGLGGTGAALQGGGATNQALGLIMKQLDKENEGKINAFKTGLAGQQNLADEASKSATIARQQGADATSNALQRKVLQLDTIQAKVEEMAAPYKSTIARTNADSLIAGLQREKDAIAITFKQQEMQKELMQNLRGLTPEQYNSLSPEVKAGLPKDSREQYEARNKLWVPGYGPATNEKYAENFTKYRNEIQPALDSLDSILFSSTRKFVIPGKNHGSYLTIWNLNRLIMHLIN